MWSTWMMVRGAADARPFPPAGAIDHRNGTSSGRECRMQAIIVLGVEDDATSRAFSLPWSHMMMIR